MNTDKSLGKHVFVFNIKDNGGESLSLSTEHFWNGDGKKDCSDAGRTPDYGIYTNQELTLQSYCNSASFELVGVQITPEILRQLANELDQARQVAVAKRNELEQKNDN